MKSHFFPLAVLVRSAYLFETQSLNCLYQSQNWIHSTSKSNPIFNRMASTENPLEGIEDVDIDSSGRFKYVLILIKDQSKQFKKHIVRGHAWGGFHADIFEDTETKLLNLGIKCKCLGGGRIEHWPDKKKISVYGYSQGYGKPDHSISTELLKKHYPDYTDISWSNDGY